MSYFKLPKTLIRSLENLMANYWWNTEAHVNKIHWCSWDRLCLPKALGGLGFKDLEVLNQALLAKQAWKMINDHECLMSRFLKSRYFPNSHFLEASVGVRPSYAWKSLTHGRELLQKGLKRSIGNGCNTRVWLDKWIEDSELGLKAPWIKCITFDVNLLVKDLIDPSSRNWNVGALNEISVPGDVELILAKQHVALREDSFLWGFNKSGNLTVKSAYWLARDQKIKETMPEVLELPSLNPIKENVWKVLASPKIRTFLWKVVSDALPVSELIIKRGMMIDSRCQACGEEGESIFHMLFQCAPARQVWALSGIRRPEIALEEGSLLGNISYLLQLELSSHGDSKAVRSWPWLLWCIWKSRNELIFKGRRWLHEEIIEKAVEEAEEWFLAQEVEEETKKRGDVVIEPINRKWNPPPKDWIMCNVGFEWIKQSKQLGVAWVVRNHRGTVLMHSRRAFSNIRNLDEARLASIIWATESMTSLHLNRVVFARDFREIFLAVKRPVQWPALRYQVDEVKRFLNLMVEYRLLYIVKEENRGAAIIAQSVTREGRIQSYVVTGHPSWLFEFFCQ